MIVTLAELLGYTATGTGHQYVVCQSMLHNKQQRTFVVCDYEQSALVLLLNFFMLLFVCCKFCKKYSSNQIKFLKINEPN